SHVARTQNGHLPADLPDGSLLQRFVVNGEQPAFTALVQRYERLVLGICQLVLADSHAAQDAFQATFVVLARKAGMLDKRRSLAGWLSKVAYRLALRWRAVTARRRRCEKQAPSPVHFKLPATAPPSSKSRKSARHSTKNWGVCRRSTGCPSSCAISMA